MEKKKTLACITLLAIVASFIGVIYYSILTAEETLTNYEEVIENGEKHIVFYEDGDRVLTFSFMYHEKYEREMYGRLIPLTLAAWHREGAHIDSMRIEIQPTDMKPAEIYLETHGNPYPPILFYEKDLATVVEIPDMEIQGEGAVTFDFLVRPLWEVENKTNFTVDVETKFSETGVFWKKYAARCQTEIEI